MGMDITEYIDEYTERYFGHRNWGYTSTYSKFELADTTQYELELNNNIVIWFDALEEEK
tara:strand:+ start:343 stop:519 length:177 start_codon:yes stop_codon:yes gene_type:complete